MSFEIIRNDITLMQVDAIVNAANPNPVIGYGVDAGIHKKAGPRLLEARKKIGKIPVGHVAITPGFQLSAKYVIHAVTPVWQDGFHGEAALLRSCYDRSLKLALRNRCESIAFPLLSAGNHGFPKDLALQIAMDAIRTFLEKYDIQVFLVVFSRDAFRLSEKLHRNVTSYIDEHYILNTNLAQYGVSDKCQVRQEQQKLILEEQLRRREASSQEQCFDFETGSCPQDSGSHIHYDSPVFSSLPEISSESPAPLPRNARRAVHAEVHKKPAKKGLSIPLPHPRPKPTLAQLLQQTDAGFSETLLKLIDRTGKKDSQIYSKANVSRQHFSKIRNNPNYKPTKSTAIAFAIALELDMEQTKDLIGRAGYALTKSSKFDVIIMYFIEEKNYNIMDINATLFEFDQSLLGA